MKTKHSFVHVFFTLSILWGLAKPDPHPLQDYCVADNSKAQHSLHMNGAPCINPTRATASHFTTSALSKPGNTDANIFGFNVTLANIANLPGLNTMGLTMARVDLAPDGLVPPHAHPRASEVTICLQGTLLVGFVDTSFRMFSQHLRPGEAFVFPKGLIHFLYNIERKSPAVAVSGLSSQNPGAQLTPAALFRSKPNIPDEILTKAFQVTEQEIVRIRRNLGG
ncbi:hypothetical protein Tsubulata_019834 [Turnera subulata]|uniref:Germin-like protein n=1 Tax=Turnera subulata TaxID=218843 RepID=A0A9Q0J7H9_9ROSI|nr:hypothetical protein Tsubulata_019834 [Turnera subulata]